MVDAERPLVLVIDDDGALRQVCLDILAARGYRGIGAASVGDGLRTFDEKSPAAVLLDLKLPDGTGLDVLRELQRRSPVTPVVVVSGYGSLPDAVEAMRLGAAEYVEKPFARDQLYQVLARVLAPGRGAPGDGGPESTTDGARYGMVGRSEAMQRVYQLVDMVAPTRARVLISGERGTGKELVARAIHALSPRRDRPFVQVNCAAVPAELIESEMFGHVKGAFTDARTDRTGRFTLAHGGTIFLDEVGELDPASQVKMLRVLQDRTFEILGSSQTRSVDVRVVAATNRNLRDAVESGAFREDLLYRLHVIAIHLPPLRDRRGDIPLLARQFLHAVMAAHGREGLELSAGAVDHLKAQEWPGNIRELRHTIERAVLVAPRASLTAADFREVAAMEAPGTTRDPLPPVGSMTLDQIERAMIVKSLRHHAGNLTRVAESLGMSRPALYRRIEKHGITV